ncbi:MAG TPA: Rrf2 family transcriptional regulator [Gemmataceae bacterium]|nr:Rrf2 family transcriptional regulator [Gemmataceae bacterium]
MKITAQEEYGVRCLLRLAQAGEGEAFTIPEIAEAEKLSPPYVAKLLSVLRQAGLITSVRGRTGGYHLARFAGEVRLGEVMRILGEPLFDEPSYCERHASPDAGGVCVHNDGCTLRVIWQTLEGEIRRFLDRVTLADLLQGPQHIGERLRAALAADLVGASDGLLRLGLAGSE